VTQGILWLTVTALGCVPDQCSSSFKTGYGIKTEAQSNEQEEEYLGTGGDASAINTRNLSGSKVPSAAWTVPQTSEFQRISAICANAAHQLCSCSPIRFNGFLGQKLRNS
jgi:hypothetical protein